MGWGEGKGEGEEHTRAHTHSHTSPLLCASPLLATVLEQCLRHPRGSRKHAAFPHFLHSPHSASRAVLRAREWIRTARVPVSERGDCFDPLQKVSTNPLFLCYSFPPTNFTPQQALSGRAGLGEDGSSDTERSKAGRQWPSRGGAEGRAPKCPTTPLRF